MREENLLLEREHPIAEEMGGEGVQRIYRFPNEYGASVVRHAFSYGGTAGKWELAVIEFDGPEEWDWNISYSTPITNDVIGWLDEDEVDETLEKIAALDSNAVDDTRRRDSMKVYVYQDDSKEWRWHLRARNGRILADSGEGYKRKYACLRILKVIFPDVEVILYEGDEE